MPESIGSPGRLDFRRPPGAISSFLRAIFDRRPAELEPGASARRIDGRILRLSWRRGLLERFRQVCGYPGSGSLPLTFPHVLAAGMHARMLLQPEFPVRLPGLVHVWHDIRQQRPLEAGEDLSLESWIEGHHPVAAGAEFCLHTTVLTGGRVVWEERTGFLSRAKARGDGRGSPPREVRMTDPRRVSEWTAVPGVGRRYARASGDYNPIHLANAAARSFGFPAAIVHGMWTLSRAVAELQKVQARPATGVYVRFKRPVFIPANLALIAGSPCEEGIPFKVSDPDGRTVFIEGWWQG